MTSPHATSATPLDTVSPRRRFVVVRNRLAGLAGQRIVDAVAARLEVRGASVRIAETRSAEEGRDVLAASTDCDVIVAAGGDGTIRGVAWSMSEADFTRPLGIIPAGTGNVLANEISLPRAAEPIANVLLEGPVRHARFATANGVPFLLMCGAGFDAQVLLRLSVKLKQRVGRAAYSGPTLQTLALDPPLLFDVDIDGHRHRASWVVVANARTYGGSFTIAPAASLLEDGLHAVVFKATSRAGRIGELLSLAAGRIERCRSVEIIPCRQVSIASPRGMPTQCDGDSLGFGPVKVACTDRTIALIVPPPPA